jgi:hypothetical protein
MFWKVSLCYAVVRETSVFYRHRHRRGLRCHLFLFWLSIFSKCLDTIKIQRSMEASCFSWKGLKRKTFLVKNGIFDHHMPIKMLFFFFTKKKHQSLLWST